MPSEISHHDKIKKKVIIDADITKFPNIISNIKRNEYIKIPRSERNRNEMLCPSFPILWKGNFIIMTPKAEF